MDGPLLNTFATSTTIQLYLEQKLLPLDQPSSVTRSNSDDYYSSFNAFAEYNLYWATTTINMKFMVGYNQEKKTHTNTITLDVKTSSTPKILPSTKPSAIWPSTVTWDNGP